MLHPKCGLQHTLEKNFDTCRIPPEADSVVQQVLSVHREALQREQDGTSVKLTTSGVHLARCASARDGGATHENDS